MYSKSSTIELSHYTTQTTRDWQISQLLGLRKGVLTKRSIPFSDYIQSITSLATICITDCNMQIQAPRFFFLQNYTEEEKVGFSLSYAELSFKSTDA